METQPKRLSDTQVQLESKIYGFGSRDDADRFVQCLRDGNGSRCIADVPPQSVADAYPPKGANPGITISPPPGPLDNDE
jgi:hypothetical protein